MAAINSFEDLLAWQKAKELTLLVYRLTRAFPTEERYGMVPQMRRAGISVTSNIAEGFGRIQIKDKEHFMSWRWVRCPNCYPSLSLLQTWAI